MNVVLMPVCDYKQRKYLYNGYMSLTLSNIFRPMEIVFLIGQPNVTCSNDDVNKRGYSHMCRGIQGHSGLPSAPGGMATTFFWQ